MAKDSPRVTGGLRTSGDSRSLCGIGRQVEVTLERCAQILPSVSDNLMSITELLDSFPRAQSSQYIGLLSTRQRGVLLA